MQQPHLRVVVFPSDDVALHRDVDAVIHELPDDLPGDLAQAAAQRELRRWYRSLTIHTRDGFGTYPDDPTIVWYVYRDGRVRRPHPSLERLYASLAVARTTCEASERAIAGARTVARSAGYGDEARPVDAFEPVIAARPRS